MSNRKHPQIFLRSILKDGEQKLALADSEGNGDINDLITGVEAGGTVTWKLDYYSNIKRILRIYPKDADKTVIFKTLPKPKPFSRGELVLRIPLEARGTEAYGIEYLTVDGRKLDIDPQIKIYPPP